MGYSVLAAALVFGCSSPAREMASPAVIDPPAASPASSEVDELDEAIRAAWRRAGVQPVEVVSDHEFLRRVTIDLVGRTPTLDEVNAFSGDRVALVDRLLASDDYARHWGDVYLDVFLPRSLQAEPRFTNAPRVYLQAVFSEGRSYERMAFELLTAAGPIHNDGAAAFLAGSSRPEEMALATAEVLLGMPEYECAQCHDHPFDAQFKQADFQALAAHFARTQVRSYQGPTGPSTELFDRDAGEYVVGKNGDKPNAVAPAVLGQPTDVREGESRRQALARAVLRSPKFAVTAVRRTWAQLFGAPPGLALENVVRRATDEFVAHDHDLRWLMRRLVLSTAYQRSASVGDLESDPVQAFGRMRLRALPARPLYRSLLYATTLSPEKPHIFPRDAAQAYENYALRELMSAEDPTSATGNLNGALYLFVATITQRGALTSPGGRLAWVLEARAQPRQRLELLYKIAYARRPTEEELRTDLGLLEESEEVTEAYEDLWFSMLTSTEFLTSR